MKKHIVRSRASSHFLSIVMPCYNAAATLQEAFASIADQQFSVPYEVVMVDDGSTDQTWQVIQDLKRNHKHIRVIHHTHNQGGGAARNTGIAHAKGTLIYCLDADNILPPHSLAHLVNFLIEQKCDGVAFHHRKYFVGDHQRLTRTVSNPLLDRAVELGDFFQFSPVVLDNFLFTKKAFTKTAGFPTHHGFDTQGFEFRFVVAGNQVRVCPDSVFLHRQFSQAGKSYFERVYENGEFSKNMYLIYEEILPLLSLQILEEILHFDIFGNASLGTRNLLQHMQQLYVQHPSTFFARKGQSLPKKSPVFHFIKATQWYHRHKYSPAYQEVQKIFRQGEKCVVVKYLMMRCVLGMTGQYPHHRIEDAVSDWSEELRPTPQPTLRKSVFSLILQKVGRTLSQKRRS